MRSGDPSAHPEPDRLRRHHLDEPRLVIVCLVAVDVHAQPFVGRQRKRELYGLLAVLARQLEMRDGANHVHAEIDGLAHEVLAVLERHDPLLGKRDQLQGHLVPDLLAQLGESADRLELGIADVDVAPHELHPVGELPPQHRADSLLDVFYRQALDAFGPDRDSLEQRSCLVVARLAHREHRVEVDVGLDQGRGDERPAKVDRLPRLRLQVADQPVFDADIPGLELPGQSGAAKQQIQHRRNANPCLNFDRPIRPLTQGESAWPQPRT